MVLSCDRVFRYVATMRRSPPLRLGTFALVASLALPAAAQQTPSGADAMADAHERARSRDKRGERKVTFGPWDAGNVRGVERQGEKGLDRHEHPPVGDPGKVPGEGPPPPPLRPDPDVPETALVGVNNYGGQGLSSNPLYFAYLLYSHTLTKVDGPRCAHLPTCSRFAAQAVARHGVVGIMMGLDRVIRPTESSAVRTLPQVEGWGTVRHLDPVANYEFWNEERFTGFPVAVDEKPPELPSLEENGPQTGADALPPPPTRTWTHDVTAAPPPAPAPASEEG
jgi:putative component of membrane protein insertase Oxa1/YidC/SpoIIIJ protein YidD